MSKQSLLLVDHDTRSMRVLEVSLRKAGFTVTTAVSVADALEKLEVHPPDLIISETTFPSEQADGFELRRRVRSTPEWAEIPFIFLTAEQTIENKIKGLELGVDDYLTKPIYIKEIVTRINILLQKRQRVRFEERRDGRTRFAGRVGDMPVVDVIQTIEISRKSGVIQFVGERGRQAAIYFRDGRVIDAEAGALQGEDAVYRLLTWSEGEFEVVFRTVRRREVITTSSQGLLMEGMRRLDEWSRLLEQLPPLTHRFEVDASELAIRLGDIPDNNNGILRLIDGKRTLLEVIDASDVGDLECLQAISRLYFEDMLIDLDHDKPVRRDTGRSMQVARPSPIEDAASGPTAMGEEPLEGTEALDLEARASSGPQPVEASAAVAQDVAPDRPSGSIPVEEQDIEEMVDQDSIQPGSMMGDFRPSSLRLIDEAVAAAQAIEPSLFDDEPAASSANGAAEPASTSTPMSIHAVPSGPVVVSPVSALPGLVRLSVRPSSTEDDDESNGTPSGSILDELEVDYPEQIGADDPTPMPIIRRGRPSSPKPSEDSGLRMIGSLGRDRAEASGELALGGSGAPVGETQRELVTILPRRTTREVPIVPAPDDAKAGDEPSAAPAATPANTDEPAPRAVPVEPPRTITPTEQRISEPPLPRRRGGLSRWLVLAAALAVGVVVYVVATSGKRPRQIATGTVIDAAVATIEIDGGAVALALDAAAVEDAPGAPPVDARALDAAIAAVVDAGVKPPVANPDSATQAKALYQQAVTALEEGDPEKALQLADASLKLRGAARAQLVRATALQRLDRVDEAIQATYVAEKLAPTYAGVYDQRGRILWAARRFDEARLAFEKFLEMEKPDSKRAAEVRRLLDRPQ